MTSKTQDNARLLLIDNVAFLLGIGMVFLSLVLLIHSLRKRMILYDSLVTANEEVERSAQIKEQFLSNMSHEIRTPLQAILAYTNRLTKEKLTIRQTQYVDAIQTAGENLLAIVNDILDVSKIESGMMRLEKVPFSLAGLLHSIDNLFQPEVRENGLYLKLHPNLVIPDTLIGDPTRLTQILVNLINNAVKFTEKGGIDIYQELVATDAEQMTIKISVQDTGIGIPKEKLSRVFERFEQVDSKMTRVYGGSGLGLYIVKELVELQNGKIEVQSDLDGYQGSKGSIFSFEIPFAVAGETIDRKAGQTELVNLTGSFGNVKVLLVEDNPMNQRVVGMFLGDWGIDFDLADNGKMAIQLLERNTYHLILMDVQMPEMDGYIVTNNHVVADADDLEVTLHDNRTFKATVIGADPSTDLALIQIKANHLATLPLVNSDEVKVGEWVLAVGNPLGLNSTVTAGIVSAKARNINILKEQFAVESFIQTDAAINPGNSGGALVNLNGGLIGINTAIASPTGSYAGYGFAIPTNIINKVVEDFLTYGAVQRGVLGVMIRSVDVSLAKEKDLAVTQGVYVDSLLENSAAATAGIQRGDVILSVDKTAVKTSPELQAVIAQHRPGDQVKVKVLRKGMEKEVTVTLNNREGGKNLLGKEHKDVLNLLGADVEDLDAGTAKKLDLDGGVKVTKLYPGKLRKNTDMREGFIITLL